jgi:hypothetical protein
MTNQDLKHFQEYIQITLKPIGWNPSEAQLQALAEAFAKEQPEGELEASQIFSRLFPNLSYFDLQGIDNSDYRALLSLAIAAAKTPAK